MQQRSVNQHAQNYSLKSYFVLYIEFETFVNGFRNTC
jgi:hypothetical protein